MNVTTKVVKADKVSAKVVNAPAADKPKGKSEATTK